MEIIEKYPDIWATVVYKQEPDLVHFDFIAYRIEGLEEGDVPVYRDETTGKDSYDHVVGETIVQGFVKWDGCSHYYFGDKKNSYVHFDGQAGLNNLTKLLQKIFDRCGEMLD